MKNIKILVSGLALLAWSTQTMAQNEVDALRYSQLGFGGTARIQGIAGAQTALGADGSTMAGNPAGLGVYRKSEVTFTPGFNFNETKSTYKGTTVPDSRNTFNISQLGLVITSRKADDVVNNWRSGSFGIGFTRLNDFQTRSTYEGRVKDNESIVQSFYDNTISLGLTENDLLAEYGTNGDNIVSLEGLAYATFLLNFDSLGAYTIPRTDLNQRESIQSKGAQNQWDFSYGASYMDKLFIGGSLSLMTVSYDQQRTFTETSTGGDPNFVSLTLTDRFTTEGAGINFRIGAIYKPVDALRIGASIQTPTFMSLTDNYNTNLSVNYQPGAIPGTNKTQYASNILPGIYNYNLTTPFRATGGLAYFFEKYAFISADAEYVNYDGASFNQDEDFKVFSQVNSRIANTYKGAVNYRVGAEGRFDVFRVRGGLALYGDPYRSSTYDRKRTYYTFGIGLKETNYFVDAAFVQSAYNQIYSPYRLESNSPVVSTKVKNSSFVVTAGFNF